MDRDVEAHLYADLESLWVNDERASFHSESRDPPNHYFALFEQRMSERANHFHINWIFREMRRQLRAEIGDYSCLQSDFPSHDFNARCHMSIEGNGCLVLVNRGLIEIVRKITMFAGLTRAHVNPWLTKLPGAEILLRNRFLSGAEESDLLVSIVGDYFAPERFNGDQAFRKLLSDKVRLAPGLDLRKQLKKLRWSIFTTILMDSVIQFLLCHEFAHFMLGHHLPEKERPWETSLGDVGLILNSQDEDYGADDRAVEIVAQLAERFEEDFPTGPVTTMKKKPAYSSVQVSDDQAQRMSHYAPFAYSGIKCFFAVARILERCELASGLTRRSQLSHPNTSERLKRIEQKLDGFVRGSDLLVLKHALPFDIPDWLASHEDAVVSGVCGRLAK